MAETEEPKTETKTKRRRGVVEKTRSADFTSVYANSAQVKIGAFDVRISLGVTPEDDKDDDIIRLEERVLVYMSPQHAKAFLSLLATNIKKYEDTFGEIRVTPKSHPEELAIIETD
ncbi:MAG TPA: DUF3467 domain-containing protein [Pyrinomonadaceae bacterium]|nr:DUF3467 domain-containing protein [Pyrinomonadaceae bacterium]